MNRTAELNLRAYIDAPDTSCEARTAAHDDLDWLLAELARKDEALRHLVGVAERAYGKALIEYLAEKPDARPGECWAEFEALGDVAAALGEQP